MNKSTCEIRINYDSEVEIQNISNGCFSPLTGFMDARDYKSVLDDSHLISGQPWTLPVTLEFPEDQLETIVNSEKAYLVNSDSQKVAELFVEDVYTVDYERDLVKIFKTNNISHPGVCKEVNRSSYRVAGKINSFIEVKDEFHEYSLSPEQARKYIKERKWGKIVGFQTRNPPHLAHEHLHKIGLEVSDGLMLQPLIGWKKPGDFTTKAVLTAYKLLVDKFYPRDHVLLNTLKTPMRYAGPREAVFHALIRKNYGCTHFIVGRDHAGVDGFYGHYEAQEFCRRFDDLGIEILSLCGPYYCNQCNQVVTEKICIHGDASRLDVSGTMIREMLGRSKIPDQHFMRKEISQLLIKLNENGELFCQ